MNPIIERLVGSVRPGAFFIGGGVVKRPISALRESLVTAATVKIA
jgi:hypothetical protein